MITNYELDGGQRQQTVDGCASATCGLAVTLTVHLKSNQFIFVANCI